MRHRARFVLAPLGAVVLGAAMLGAAWLVTACGNGASPVLGVTIQGGDRTLEVDDTVLLTAAVEVTGTAATTVSWSSDDPATATVDAAGLVTAVGIGEASVTATSTVDATRHDSVAISVVPSGTHVWTRQFGTPAFDFAWAVAVDAAGHVLVAGSTYGALPGRTHLGGADAFVSKLDAGGDQLWTVQFGTAEDDEARGVAVDAEGNVLVVGTTFGALPDQVHLGDRDVFVTKLDPDGTLLWTRQFGTTTIDNVAGVVVDAAGNVFVVGNTWGALPGQTNAGLTDAFVVRFDPNGVAVWTLQFGTPATDAGLGVAIDPAGYVLVAGVTAGTLPGQTHFGGADAFVVKLDAADGDPVWTHQFGTSGHDDATSVAVDADGNVLVAGLTAGAFPGQSHLGEVDAFVRKLDADGEPVWTRQFGSDGNDPAFGLAIDTRGDLVVSGYTDGVLDGASPAGNADAFAIKLDPDGERLWTQQYGTVESDYGNGVAVDARGFVLLVGTTQGALGGPNAGETDAFVRRLKP